MPVDFDRLSDYFQTGKITQPPRLVLGGKVNQVWKISTDKKSYALKRIRDLPVNLFRYRQVEAIALQFQKHGILAVTAHCIDNAPVAEMDQDHFMLFDWVEGKVLTPGKIKRHHVEKMGGVLAQMHGINVPSSSVDLSVLNDVFYSFEFSKGRWQALIDQARVKKIKSIDSLQAHLSLIIEASEQAKASWARLKTPFVISHRDMSPHNVVWKNDETPAIIDWELAGLIHPTVEFIGAAFDWSLLSSQEMNEQRFQAFIRAYCEAGGNVVELSDAFYTVMGIWLSWMEFNIRRFIDAEAPAEREVEYTLSAFIRIFPQQARWIRLVDESRVD